MIAIKEPGTLIKEHGAEDMDDQERAGIREILNTVRREGDAALRRLTAQFDRVQLQELRLSYKEMDEALHHVSEDFVKALRQAVKRIYAYHERQLLPSSLITEEDGTVLGQLVRPLERVGVYVPGGRAAYPSTVLMTVIPARVAGVSEIVMMTPPGPEGKVDPSILVAAREAGVTEIWKVGGAQAIGALAYGTESVRKVDKIVGPGNRYVALAKREVYGLVDIDMIAGPSEVVIITDESADPAYVAADLLAQAEHDPLASAVLLTTCKELATQVILELKFQCRDLKRHQIVKASLQKRGAICITTNLDEAINTANQLAPEHLQLMVKQPWNWVGKIKHAGAIFLGTHSPEAIGDYIAGPSHVLPTNGTARFFSPLGVDDFVKKSSLIAYSQEGLQRDGAAAMLLAEKEGLDAHAASIRARLQQRRGNKDGTRTERKHLPCDK